MATGVKACGGKRWLVFVREIPRGGATDFSAQPAVGGIAEDAKEPRLEAGSCFEARQGLEHGKPSLLHHFIGIGLADDATGQVAQLAVVGAYQLGKCLFVTGEQSFDQHPVVGE